MSVTFDSTEIVQDPYITRIVQHESSPEREIKSLPLSRDNGSVYVSSRYGSKTIRIEGYVVEGSQNDLEERIDLMKELFSREQKNLDIAWNGSTRRYVATCVKHNFDRDHFHLLYVPFSADFLVPAGVGIDTLETTPLDEEEYDVSSEVDVELTIAGSAKPEPVITIEGANWASGCRGISLTNDDTGERFLFSRNVDWGNTAIVEIDCGLKQVIHSISGVETSCDFAGLIPQFAIGENTFRLKAGSIVNQSTLEESISDVDEGAMVVNATVDGKHRTTQKISLPYTDETVQGIRIAVLKIGSPLTFNIRIETDDDGAPSGTLVDANAYGSRPQGDFTSSMAYYEFDLAGPITLEANTTYWIVCEPGNTAVDYSTNYFIVGTVNGVDEIYTDGGYMADIGDPTSWGTPSTTVSQAFQLLTGGVDGTATAKVTVRYRKTHL